MHDTQTKSPALTGAKLFHASADGPIQPECSAGVTGRAPGGVIGYF
jgi:hypothetical protein